MSTDMVNKDYHKPMKANNALRIRGQSQLSSIALF